MTAVKHGGPDPDMNLSLRYAIDKARQVNMPRDNIERAIKAAVGGDNSVDYAEVIYEGYGPLGVAFMVSCLTDNRNRTAPEMRKLFEKGGGNMGSTGCVAHQFDRKAQFLVPKDKITEEALMDLVLLAGADDLKADEEAYEVTGSPESFSAIREALAEANLEPTSGEVAMIPSIYVMVEDEEEATRILKLMEQFDDHDDVDTVWSNFDIPDSILEKVTSK
jgi:YebC/PmpR family DNA-binding regulatory protein